MSNSNFHFIGEPDAVSILRQYEIPYPAHRFAQTAEEAIQGAEETGYPILAGLRGQKPRDLEALANLLLAVSRLVSERPDIEELDLNPVRLYEQGLLVLDARIMA